MNRDGTCEGPITAGNVVGSRSWQPLPGGPSVGLKRCHAVSVDATLSFAPATAYLGGTIVNEGTEPLTNVVVTVTATRNDFDLHAVVGAGCTKPRARVVCRVGRIARGERRFVYLIGKPRRVGRDKRSSDIVLRARFEVSADEPSWRQGGKPTRSTSHPGVAIHGIKGEDGSTARGFPIGSADAAEPTTSIRATAKTWSMRAPALTRSSRRTISATWSSAGPVVTGSKPTGRTRSRETASTSFGRDGRSVPR